MDTIIVSRHAAAIEFIARELGGQVVGDMVSLYGGGGFIPIVAQATADDVAGKHVYGNLPLHLAALAAIVTVVEFEGAPPRGQEYSLADMEKAGSVLRSYVVMQEEDASQLRSVADAAHRNMQARMVAANGAAETAASAIGASDAAWLLNQDRQADEPAIGENDAAWIANQPA